MFVCVCVGGGGGIYSRELIRRRLQILCLAECVSKCGPERSARCQTRPAHYIFRANFGGLATIRKLNNKETLVCRTKFGIQVLLFIFFILTKV